MKKIFVPIILFLFFTNNGYSFNKWGEGELQLSENVINIFASYIRLKGKENPADFYVTLDGTDAIYWTCSAAQACTHGDPVADIKRCLEVTGKQCKKFARIRTVRWKNGINEGKGKTSKFSSKMSDQEIRVKLTSLGFYNNNSKTISNDQNTSNSKLSTEIVEQLKSLKELLDQNVITQDEFNSAKQKILNNI